MHWLKVIKASVRPTRHYFMNHLKTFSQTSQHAIWLWTWASLATFELTWKFWIGFFSLHSFIQIVYWAFTIKVAIVTTSYGQCIEHSRSGAVIILLEPLFLSEKELFLESLLLKYNLSKQHHPDCTLSINRWSIHHSSQALVPELLSLLKKESNRIDPN